MFNPSGILVTYTKNFKSKNSSSKAEHGWPSRGYNLPKALCIRGRIQGFDMSERSDNNPQKDLADRNESGVSIDTQLEEGIIKGEHIIETTD